MTRVNVRDGNVDKAMRMFKQKVAKNGVPSEVKKRAHAVKPGDKRRAAKKEGIKNTQKRNKASRNRD